MSYKFYLNEIKTAIKLYAIALAECEPELEDFDEVVDVVRADVDEILADMAYDLTVELGDGIPVGDIYDEEAC